MRAGSLRDFVTVYSKGTITQDSFGQDSFTWQGYGPYPANVQPVEGGTERDASEQRFEGTRYRVTMRPVDITIDTTMYLVWNEKKLEILDVLSNSEEMRQSVVLICIARVA